MRQKLKLQVENCTSKCAIEAWQKFYLLPHQDENLGVTAAAPFIQKCENLKFIRMTYSEVGNTKIL